MPYLGIFGLELKKTYVIFKISTLEFCLTAEYREIMKMPKFGTKSALFGYFWARILKKTIVIFETNTLEFV